MFINIKPSRNFVMSKVNWAHIILTILSPSKTIVNENHVSYLRKFYGFTIDVHVYRYETTFYVVGAAKNGTL